MGACWRIVSGRGRSCEGGDDGRYEARGGVVFRGDGDRRFGRAGGVYPEELRGGCGFAGASGAAGGIGGWGGEFISSAECDGFGIGADWGDGTESRGGTGGDG